jgi:DNA-binding CsgD family transcriptional regulator/tetratricopeptide (TPR) repeat protein
MSRRWRSFRRRYLALINWWAHAGYYRTALPVGESFVETAKDVFGDRYLTMHQAIEGHVGLGHIYAALGRPDDARREYEIARSGYIRVQDYSMLEYTMWSEMMMVLTPYRSDNIGDRARLASDAARAWKVTTGITVAGPIDRAPTEVWLDILEGRWAEAIQLARESLSGTNTNMVYGGIATLAWLACHRGERDEAWRWVFRFFPDGPLTEPGDHFFPLALIAQMAAAELSLDAGDLDTARRWIETRERWISWSGALLWRAETQLLWARYHRLDGDLDNARQNVRRARQLASEPRQPLVLVAADRLLGELATADRDTDSAERHLQQSLDLAQACRAVFEEARTLLALAELRASTDRIEEAESLIARVREICVPLDAKPTLRRAGDLVKRLRRAPSTARVRFGLTPRELDVLRLLVDGKTDREIAVDLFISHHTVMNHVSNILGKLEVDSRTAAATFAVRHELV